MNKNINNSWSRKLLKLLKYRTGPVHKKGVIFELLWIGKNARWNRKLDLTHIPGFEPKKTK